MMFVKFINNFLCCDAQIPSDKLYCSWKCVRKMRSVSGSQGIKLGPVFKDEVAYEDREDDR